MKRREFIGLLGGAVACPLDARAQQARVSRIGYLANVAPEATADLWGAFREGLRGHGYVEGKNAIIEYRWAANLPQSLAAELVALNVDVIVAWGTPAVATARRATAKIPIVMVGIADPIGAGFIVSLARPGGNITGTTNLAADLGGKLLELLRELVPAINPAVVLHNPTNPAAHFQLRDLEVAASSAGVRLVIINVETATDIPAAFARMKGERTRGVIAPADPLLISQRTLIANLARGARLPMVFGRRESVDAGGLVSYGPSLREQFRDTATYVDKILKGASPGDLPVQQPTKFELVINLKTAKELGLTIPPVLLARADEVIE